MFPGPTKQKVTHKLCLGKNQVKEGSAGSFLDGSSGSCCDGPRDSSDGTWAYRRFRDNKASHVDHCLDSFVSSWGYNSESGELFFPKVSGTF